MADKLILNANMICKADRFVPKKCTVEKVIEVSDSEFKKFIENPMKRNYYLYFADFSAALPRNSDRC